MRRASRWTWLVIAVALASGCGDPVSIGDAQRVFVDARLAQLGREAKGEWSGTFPGVSGLPNTQVVMTLAPEQPTLLSYRTRCTADSCPFADIFTWLFGTPPETESSVTNQFEVGTIQLLALHESDAGVEDNAGITASCVILPGASDAAFPALIWLSESGDTLRLKPLDFAIEFTRVD